jgi:hypothetical protein
MAGATKTTIAAAIQTAFAPGLTKTFYEGMPLLGMFPKFPNPGGDSYDWKLNYAGNSSAAVYTEGATPPAAGNQSYADMTVADEHIWVTVQITGHAKDAARNGYFDPVRKEMEGGVSALQHKIEEQFVTYFEAAIDNSATYGGQTRTTVHADSVTVPGGSAALTLAMLSSMYEQLKLDPRDVQFNNPNEYSIISSPEQLTAYTEIGFGLHKVGDDESTGINRPYTTMSGDAVADAGLLKHTLRYNNIPWYEVATVTNTLVFLTKNTDVFIAETRPLTIEPLGKTDDSDKFLLTWAGAMGHRDPYRAARIEALTT